MSDTTDKTRAPAIRALAAVTALASVASFLGGVSYARVSSMARSQNSTFSAGTVTVGSASSVQSCSISGVLPGTTTGAATLTTALASGQTNITSLAVSPLAKQATQGDTLLLGEAATTQLVTVASGHTAAAGSTTVVVNAFTGNAAYPVGTMVSDLSNQNHACSFAVTYTGTVSAYVAADVLVVSGGAIWSGSAGSLQLSATDASDNVYSLPTAALANCAAAVGSQFGTTSSGGTTCGETNDDLLSTTTVSNGTGYTLNLNWVLPSSSPSTAQGTSVQVYVLFHAVQARNDALACTTTATVGQPCTPSGAFKWS